MMITFLVLDLKKIIKVNMIRLFLLFFFNMKEKDLPYF